MAEINEMPFRQGRQVNLSLLAAAAARLGGVPVLPEPGSASRCVSNTDERVETDGDPFLQS